MHRLVLEHSLPELDWSSTPPLPLSGTSEAALATLLRFAYARCLPAALPRPAVWADEKARAEWERVMAEAEETANEQAGGGATEGLGSFGEYKKKFQAKAEICKSELEQRF